MPTQLCIARLHDAYAALLCVCCLTLVASDQNLTYMHALCGCQDRYMPAQHQADVCTSTSHGNQAQQAHACVKRRHEAAEDSRLTTVLVSTKFNAHMDYGYAANHSPSAAAVIPESSGTIQQQSPATAAGKGPNKARPFGTQQPSACSTSCCLCERCNASLQHAFNSNTILMPLSSPCNMYRQHSTPSVYPRQPQVMAPCVCQGDLAL